MVLYSLPGEELAGVEGCDGVLADLLGDHS